jgi:hypothetical protein
MLQQPHQFARAAFVDRSLPRLHAGKRFRIGHMPFRNVPVDVAYGFHQIALVQATRQFNHFRHSRAGGGDEEEEKAMFLPALYLATNR